jgi:uncharacterized RDD family membrane protein YckC
VSSGRNYMNVGPSWTPAPQPPDLYWLNQPHEGQPAYAGFWRRFFASCIDGVLLGIAAKIIDAIMSPVLDEFVTLPAFDSWIVVVGFFVSVVALYSAVDWLYFAILESSAMQATLGKRALGIVVTDLAGNRISFGRATGRYLARWLSLLTLMIGYLIQPFTSRRQALHDLISGTLVLRGEASSTSPVAPPTAGVLVDTEPRRGMSGLSKGLLLGSLAVVIGCASISYLVALPKIRDYIDRTERRTTEQIAATIDAQVSLRIGPASPSGDLVLSEIDLDVNNGYAADDSFGVQWGSEGTIVYGFVTTIDRTGIVLGSAEDELFRFVPSVVDGQVAFASVGDQDGLTGFILSQESFEQGLEDGINQALSARGLRPKHVVLNQNSLTIEMELAVASDSGSSARKLVSGPESMDRRLKMIRVR